MKIIQFVSTYPPYKGGTGRVAAEFHRGLFGKKEEVATLVPRYPFVNGKMDAGVELLEPWFVWGNGAFVPIVYSKLKKADAVLFHYPFFGGVEPLILFKLFHKKVPLTVYYHQDLVPPRDLFRSLLFRFYNRCMLPFLVRAADTICVSTLDYAKNGLLKKWIRKYPGKFVEVPLGVDHELFQRNEEAALRWCAAAGFDEHTPLITFVGGLDPAHSFKGIPVLLDAFADLSQDIPRAQLCIVGQGSCIDYYRGLAQQRGIGDSVHFFTAISKKELPAVYGASWAHILPSTNAGEAFGLVLVEAMACGAPVIASDLPGVRTVFEDGVSGFSFPVGNAQVLAEKLRKLCKDDTLRKEMSVAARERAQRYTWSKTISLIEEIVQNENSHNK